MSEWTYMHAQLLLAELMIEELRNRCRATLPLDHDRTQLVRRHLDAIAEHFSKCCMHTLRMTQPAE